MAVYRERKERNKLFPTSPDSRRASCQLLAKEWALNTDKPFGKLAQEQCGSVTDKFQHDLSCLLWT